MVHYAIVLVKLQANCVPYITFTVLLSSGKRDFFYDRCEIYFFYLSIYV